jgi:hypothetical protein
MLDTSCVIGTDNVERATRHPERQAVLVTRASGASHEKIYQSRRRGPEKNARLSIAMAREENCRGDKARDLPYRDAYVTDLDFVRW